ncbi:MAG: hypothetical protein LBB47_04715 [Spirochaetaceae bacterium]|nr:hypothetical protein [Spirochaetaceae bacterium]
MPVGLPRFFVELHEKLIVTCRISDVSGALPQGNIPALRGRSPFSPTVLVPPRRDGVFFSLEH